MLKLKLQYFGHLMQTAVSLEKSLMLGKNEGRRRKGHQRMRWLDGITDGMDVNLGKLWERARTRESWGTVVHGVTIELDTTEQLNKMTTMLEKDASSPNPTIISLFIIWTAETKAL